MNTDAFRALDDYLTNGNSNYLEIYTLSGQMYYSQDNGNTWFKEGSTTAITLGALRSLMDTRMIKSIESDDGTVWSIPGTVDREEYIGSITSRPYVDNRSSDDCSVCLLPLDTDICKLSNPRCPHVFHCDCINNWVNSRGGQISCPLCRQIAHDIVPVVYTSFGKKKRTAHGARTRGLISEIRYLRSL